MDPEVKTRLLASIEAGRLVVVCGAGLSMAPPSSLPSAKSVAETCFQACVLGIDQGLNPNLREDLEGLADRFEQLNMLETVFIEKHVPWESFARPWNAGHAAVADLLITRAAASALSANYDILIERCAAHYGADFLPSLDGDEATVRADRHSPLLKFHGCAQRDRRRTIWTKRQLDIPVVANRISKSKTWMAANLREKDILLVGFWSDWAYLNNILGDAMKGVAPNSVTVVDPSSPDQLEEKAPDLWALAHEQDVHFAHVQRSGADVLDELRREFSRAYLRKMLYAGKNAFEDETNTPCEPNWMQVDDFGSEALYDLRRDAEGVPSSKPATTKEPVRCETLGLFHLLLRRAGAVAEAQGYRLAGQIIRPINGSGTILNRLRACFQEPPSAITTDVVVAVGSTDLPGPDNVVRAGRPGDILRPAPTETWLNFQDGRERLGI